jgi:hypothetical protein
VLRDQPINRVITVRQNASSASDAKAAAQTSSRG